VNFVSDCYKVLGKVRGEGKKYEATRGSSGSSSCYTPPAIGDFDPDNLCSEPLPFPNKPWCLSPHWQVFDIERRYHASHAGSRVVRRSLRYIRVCHPAVLLVPSAQATVVVASFSLLLRCAELRPIGMRSPWRSNSRQSGGQ
jgi:hypothetical protein